MAPVQPAMDVLGLIEPGVLFVNRYVADPVPPTCAYDVEPRVFVSAMLPAAVTLTDVDALAAPPGPVAVSVTGKEPDWLADAPTVTSTKMKVNAGRPTDGATEQVASPLHVTLSEAVCDQGLEARRKRSVPAPPALIVMGLGATTSGAGGTGVLTVTVALALAEPVVAVMVAVPALEGVIVASCGEPANVDAEATLLLLDVQFIVATDIA